MVTPGTEKTSAHGAGSPTSRRQFLTTTLAGAGVLAVRPQGEPNWNPGIVRHLLPAVSHNRLRLKAGFDRPLTAVPLLRAGSRSAPGVRTDTAGEFYSFDIAGLEPERRYNLELLDPRRQSRCATRGRSRFFPIPKRNRSDSACWFIPAPAVIQPRSTPIRVTPTGCRSPIGERCC